MLSGDVPPSDAIHPMTRERDRDRVTLDTYLLWIDRYGSLFRSRPARPAGLWSVCLGPAGARDGMKPLVALRSGARWRPSVGSPRGRCIATPAATSRPGRSVCGRAVAPRLLRLRPRRRRGPRRADVADVRGSASALPALTPLAPCQSAHSVRARADCRGHLSKRALRQSVMLHESVRCWGSSATHRSRHLAHARSCSQAALRGRHIEATPQLTGGATPPRAVAYGTPPPVPRLTGGAAPRAACRCPPSCRCCRGSAWSSSSSCRPS